MCCPLCALRMAPCRDVAEMQARWREHFSGLESGVCAKPPELLERATRKRVWHMPSSIGSVPTELDLADALRAAAPGKAPGGDGLPHGACIAGASALAAKMAPLALKVSLRGVEPIGFKAGLLHHLYKGRGDRSLCSSHRGILLLPSLGKAVHRTLRPRLEKHFVEHSLTFQIGGKKGQSTAFGVHAVRSFIRAKVQAGCSCAVLFADVQAAYYAAARQLAAPSDGPVDVEAVCQGLALTRDDREALCAHLREVLRPGWRVSRLS